MTDVIRLWGKDLGSTIGRPRVTATLDDVQAQATAIRAHALRTVANVGEGYLLQALGAGEILAGLYFSELRLDPGDPGHPDRDRCLLSTAHNSVGLYATLAQRGYFDVAALDRYGQDGSTLEIISSELVPGVEGTFGSLGQALSVGIGFALSARLQERDYRTYVILGDGEMQEGQTWEAGMAAAAYGLDNLCLIVDLNGMQVEGATQSVLAMGNVGDKWRSFGWSVQEINGNDAGEVLRALDAARATRGAPAAIIATTVPGHPVSFLAGRLDHYAKLTSEQAQDALAELEDHHGPDIGATASGSVR
jgi:transketolase